MNVNEDDEEVESGLMDEEDPPTDGLSLLDEEDTQADRPSLYRQQEDATTLQSTFREGSTTDPPVLDVSNIPKTWPEPHFCTRCGWIGQGKKKNWLMITA